MPEDDALVILGWRMTSATGDIFDCEWRDKKFKVQMPPWDSLPKPPGSSDINDRYALRVASVAAAMWPDVLAEARALRRDVAPYAIDLDACAKVKKWLRARCSFEVVCFRGEPDILVRAWDPPGRFIATLADVHAPTEERAICLAALAVAERGTRDS
ncbi:MAG: hypothetical protein Q7S02_06445 [bacterium]|nr:hypothetical protein [bacterium]